MNPGFTLKEENPGIRANILSKLFFRWSFDIYSKIKEKGLEIKDLYKVEDEDESDGLANRLENYWKQEIHKAKKSHRDPSLLKALFNTFKYSFVLWGIVNFLQIMSRSLPPILLSYFLKLFIDQTQDNLEINLYIFGTILILAPLFTLLALHHTFYNLLLIATRARVAVSSLVYRKITRLNQNSLGKISTGEIVNLISNDVSRFDLAMIFVHTFWIMPFFIILNSYLLWCQLGISSIAGIALMVLLTLPLQGYVAQLFGKYRLQIAKKTDNRVRLIHEIVSGIQVIKMYTWEKPYEKIVKESRDSEMSFIKIVSQYQGVLAGYVMFLSGMCLYVALNCYTILGNKITSDRVFSSTQCFVNLQFAFAIALPRGITNCAEALTSIRRLKDFLTLEERENTQIGVLPETGIQINGISASWDNNSTTLKNITLRIQPGTLCAIVGPVGSGKTSLLQVLLGELIVSCGQINIGGDISYASQEPWLFSASLQDNILFGQPYNKYWYNTVVQACALNKDFRQLPHGDRTLVGEKGVLLSGGQKARVNLARAVYRQADIYIMDDPLSAVDTRVGKYLFNECICKHLEKKIRILVTHQLQYLKDAHLIVVMNKGQIEATGTYDELVKNRLDFNKIIALTDESNVNCSKENNKLNSENIIRRPSALSQTSNNSFMETLEQPEYTAQENPEESWANKNSISVVEYFKHTKNNCVIMSLVLLLILSQALVTSSEYWVAFWTEQEEAKLADKSDPILQLEPITNLSSSVNYSYINNTSDDSSTMYIEDTYLETEIALGIYGALIISALIATFIRSYLFFKAAMMASKNLHEMMFHCILLAPMRFFNTNPCGRILNRFSKDIGAIDEMLPKTLLDAIQVSLILIGGLVNTGISNPYTIVAVVICAVPFWNLLKLFISTATCVRHLEGVTKSPVFSHVRSTMDGLPTIRASKCEKLIIAEFDHHQNVHSSAWLLSLTCMSSFGLWLDTLSVILIACVTFGFIFLNYFYAVPASFVGLALSQVMGMTGKLQYGMKQVVEVANQFASIERVLQYTTLETEGPFETLPENKPDQNWPNAGTIEFKHVSLKYVDTDPPVLKDIVFTIREGEKIGIVGRTGAGKSSLISATFRFTDIDGSIVIDGIDTKKLGLSDLRKKISIIPQEPVLFSSTIRYNLDPFDDYDDEMLWKALEEVKLRDSITSLDYLVTEGGSNFSLGQRQLICLARALLRKNKILILDEATANVDLRTDVFIQATIREKCKKSTVLTIAHRLNTIMDSDRVMVMSAGTIVEFDHPHVLLLKEDGYLSKMVRESGSAMAQQLKDIALDDFQNNIFVEKL